MTTFLIIAVAGTLLVGIVLIWPLVTGGGRAAGRDEMDAAIYRDQLAELDRDVARGTIDARDADGARAEIARRLIAATKRVGTQSALGRGPIEASRLTALIAIIAAPALAAVIYLQIGSPGQKDLPLASRTDRATAALPSQEEAEKQMAGRIAPAEELDPEYAALLKRLEDIVANRPDDVQGYRLLARGLARAGRWVEARKANDRLIELLGIQAKPDDFANQAEAMIFAAGGYVSPQAMAALEKVLKADPANVMGRYYAGFALRQGGRVADAVGIWRALLNEDRASATPRGPEWQEALAALIREAGGAGTGDTAPRGPTKEDVDAADDMSAEDRKAMIEGMVARLEERLTERGGDPEEWVRLINAYLVLEKPDDARRILALSQEKIGEQTARAFVRERALLMGIEAE